MLNELQYNGIEAGATSPSSPSQIILSEFRNCFAELLRFYTSTDPTLRDGEGQCIGGEATAIIGLSDPKIAVTLSLTTTKNVISLLCPSDLAVTHDWLGELANQLAGKLKNRLVEYGHLLNLSIPTTVAGKWLQVHPAGVDSYLVVAAFDENIVAGQITMELNPDLNLERKTDTCVLDQNSIQLFWI